MFTNHLLSGMILQVLGCCQMVPKFVGETCPPKKHAKVEQLHKVGPLSVISGLISPITGVITPVAHL